MDSLSAKSILGIIAVALTFIGYIPYFKSILTGKTKPHLYSWVIWLFTGLIIFALQVTSGAGPGAFVTLSAALMSATVIILALRRKEKQDVTVVDAIFALLALLALGLWLIAKEPLLSALLIMAVDILGFLPTVRKSWKNPHSEIPLFYAINIVRFTFGLAALSQYTIITMLYPGFWLIANTGFTAMLLIRKKK